MSRLLKMVFTDSDAKSLPTLSALCDNYILKSKIQALHFFIPMHKTNFKKQSTSPAWSGRKISGKKKNQNVDTQTLMCCFTLVYIQAESDKIMKDIELYLRWLSLIGSTVSIPRFWQCVCVCVCAWAHFYLLIS